MRPYTLYALLVVLMIGTAMADHDPAHCETAEPEVDTGETPAGRFYVDNDPCQPDCLFSVWIYQESNGQDGLQRGDTICNDDGVCCEGDTIIF